MAGWGEREERRTRDLLLVVSWKTPEEDVGAGEGKVEMGRWGDRGYGVGKGRPSRGESKGEGPEDWKCKSRFREAGGSLSGKYPLEDEQGKLNLGIWGRTSPEGLKCQAGFGLAPAGRQ